MKHSDYITHIDNEEDEVYLKTRHFPVNMRLFETSKQYKDIILQQCNYIKELCLDTKDGYKKPHGMSSANAGLSFNIIGITLHRNKPTESCLIMINPIIIDKGGELIKSSSNCGSLTLDKNIIITRYSKVTVEWYSPLGRRRRYTFNRTEGSLTVQHEIDHNNGILITDRI